jgi:glycosyltransferase involved in cell wall biosynthesis
VVVGTVANLRATKGYPDLLEAARQVVAGDARLRFVAVGQGQLADDLERRHEQLGLGERFRFLGYRPDAARTMAAFDIFVLASHHEGRPVALMEAMALGLPCVVTSVGGVPEMVTDGVDAILMPPGRPDDLAGAVLDLAGDLARRQVLAAAAQLQATAFGASPAVARVEAVYRQAARARR